MRRFNVSVVILILLSASSCNRNPANNSSSDIIYITTYAIDTNFTNEALWVKTNTLIWMYDTSGFSTVSLIISGNTNAESICIETYGDGLITKRALDLNIDNYFNDTVGIAFSHISGKLINCDTRIFLTNNNNDTVQVSIFNPLL